VYGKTLASSHRQIGRESLPVPNAFGLRTIAWSRSLTPERAEQLGVERCESVDDVFRQRHRHAASRARTDTRKLVTGPGSRS